MARATRSSAQLSTDQNAPHHHQHPRSKKRKRVSTADSDDEQPNQKQLRSSHPSLPNAADTHLQNEHAQNILDILEMIDTQGLLDRVFSNSTSLRALLKQPQLHTLTTIRTAIQSLFPISSLPRSKPSHTASQQLRFCSLALSLLSHASFHTSPIPLSFSSILPADSDSSSTRPTPRKYALVQHLPTGDYWTSLNSDTALLTALKDLPTAQAELVAILPTPPPPKLSKSTPTLGSYKPTKPAAPPKPLPTQRRVSTGVFLDYGIWASFAPSFDHDAQVVGQRELESVVYSWELRKKEKEKLSEWSQSTNPSADIEEVPPPSLKDSSLPRELVDAEVEQLLPPDEVDAIKAALGCLELENAVQELLERNHRALIRLEELQVLRLTSDDGGSSTAEEGSEEWDTAQGILDSLAVLASLRPRAANNESETLPNSILPSPSVIRKLHRSLALEPTPGWFGTLPPIRATALRDDNTIKVRPNANATNATPATATTTTTATTTATSTPTTTTSTTAIAPIPVAAPMTPYGGYAYAYGTPQQQQQQMMQYHQQVQSQPYRPQSTNPATPVYTPYKSQYYPYAPPAQGQQAAASGGQMPMTMQTSYYGQQQQGYAAAAYSGWYNAYQGGVAGVGGLGIGIGGSAAAGGSGSGSGTPQPQTQQVPPPVIASSTAATYGSFFGGGAAAATTNAGSNSGSILATDTGSTGTPPPGGVKIPAAVANTVVSGAGQGQGGALTPTLPVHLRSGQGQGQGVAAGSYYGAYQPPAGVR